jgi:hypothetical protein
MKYLLLFILPLPLLANTFQLSEEELHPESEEVLLKKPEKFQRHESMIYNFNTDLGIKDQRRYTGEDRNRFSIAGHLSGDYEHFNRLLGGEVTYMRRSTRYNQMWWGAQFFQHSTYFTSITQNATASGSPNSEGSFQRGNYEKNKILGVGIGASYRFKLLLDFYPTEDVFENIDVFLNSIQLDESFIEKRYQGYGLTTNYGIHKRSGQNYFYGGKLSYNISSVTRSAIGNENARDRSLSLGWFSFAFEMGFFY